MGERFTYYDILQSNILTEKMINSAFFLLLLKLGLSLFKIINTNFLNGLHTYFFNSSGHHLTDGVPKHLYYENTAVEPCAICLILGMALNQAKLNFLKAALVSVQGFKKLKQI